MEQIQLANGINIPMIGLGVYKISNDVIGEVVTSAYHFGYRLIDTAAFYQNEEGIGEIVKRGIIPRNDLFITTKVWNQDQGYKETKKAFLESIKKLQTDSIDLYLVHWPVKTKYIDTWKAIEELYQEGRIKSIGVSNFNIHHLETLMEKTSIVPMVNQVELHPYLSQLELRDFCKTHHIAVQAWSPLARTNIFEDTTIVSLSNKKNISPAQLILRWHYQNGVISIPKTQNQHRLQENINLFHFDLKEEEMEEINQLNQNHRFGPDPDTFDF